MCGNIIDRDGYYPGFISPLLFLGLGPWWLGLVWSLNTLPAPSEAFCTPTHTNTHTLTTAMSHLSNSSVRDHMKWVSVFFPLHLSTFVWKRRPSFSFCLAFMWINNNLIIIICNSLPQRGLTQNVHRFVYK